jgi:ketosteroid isomerase-like protein
MTRTPEEVFQHHAQALGDGDLDEIVADYADDAVCISPAGSRHGKDGVRAAFTQLLADVPDAAWDLKTLIYEGDILFLEWAADAAATRVDDHEHLTVVRRLVRDAWLTFIRQPAEVTALRAAALRAGTGSQPWCFHTILPEAEVSTNHG